MESAPYIETRTEKKCCDCKRFLTLDNFWKNRSKWDGLAGICKLCVASRKAANPEQANKHIRAWQKRNPDKVRESARVYRKKNKAKQRQKERAKPGYKLKRKRHEAKRRQSESYKLKRKRSEKARRLRSILELKDRYVKRALCQGTDLKPRDLPQELVELKRLHLKVYRQIKQQTKN